MYADNNLFNAEWTTGSLKTIAPIVHFVGFFAMCVISVGGFFMVILPLIRNVINGIVVVAPNLCDKIDEAHRTKLGFKHSEGGNQIVSVIGSISATLFSLLPNFKAMSDFEDGVKDPKSYMLKAIPSMCIYIFIGVFIFQGFPAQLAEKFSTAATSFLRIALDNVDPAALVEKIPTNLARPDFSTEHASDETGKKVYKVSSAMYGAFTSKYSEMSKEGKVALSHTIEEYVQGILTSGDIGSQTPNVDFTVSAEARISSFQPNFTPVEHDEGEHVYTYQFCENVLSRFGQLGDQTIVQDLNSGDFILLTVKYYENATTQTEVNTAEVVLTLHNSIQTDATGSYKARFELPSGTGITVTGGSNGTCIVGGVTFETTDGKTFRSKDTLASGTHEVSGMFYKSSNPVAQITFGSTSTDTFDVQPKDTSKYEIKTKGGRVTVKADANSTTQTDGNNTNENDESGVPDDF